MTHVATGRKPSTGLKLVIVDEQASQI